MARQSCTMTRYATKSSNMRPRFVTSCARIHRPGSDDESRILDTACIRYFVRFSTRYCSELVLPIAVAIPAAASV
eukprot:scaffold4503_cov167-Amphora_coffeaeformis.AAC.7